MTNVLQALFICVGIIASLTLQAEQNGIYRWTDNNGVTQYSDRPPEGVESMFVKTSTGKRAPATEPEPTTTASEDNAPQTMEVMPEKDPALCKQAQQNLKALESARIRITEPDGSKRIITEEEKEAQRENARKFIKVHC